MPSGLSPLWLMGLALALGTVTVSLIPLALSTATVKLTDWIGFAGNVVGAFVTLAAAIIAWFAVQRQIAAAAQLAERQEVALLELASSEMLPIAQMYALAWRAVDAASAYERDDPERAERGLRLAQTLTPDRQVFDAKMAEIMPFGDKLHPLKRWQLLDIEHSGKLLGEYFERENAELRPHLHVVAARARFTYFARAVEAFDPKLTSIFVGLVRTELNGDSEAEQLRPLVDHYEATGYVG